MTQENFILDFVFTDNFLWCSSLSVESFQYILYIYISYLLRHVLWDCVSLWESYKIRSRPSFSIGDFGRYEWVVVAYWNWQDEGWFDRKLNDLLFIILFVTTHLFCLHIVRLDGSDRLMETMSCDSLAILIWMITCLFKLYIIFREILFDCFIWKDRELESYCYRGSWKIYKSEFLIWKKL